MRLHVLNVHNVKKQTINEQKRAVSAAAGGPYANRTLLKVELRTWASGLAFIFKLRGQLYMFI